LALHAEQPALLGAAAAPEPAAQRTSFCVVQGLDFAHHVRKPATLMQATRATRSFYPRR